LFKLQETPERVKPCRIPAWSHASRGGSRLPRPCSAPCFLSHVHPVIRMESRTPGCLRGLSLPGGGLFSRTRRRGVDPNTSYGHAPPHGASPSRGATGAGTDEPVFRAHRAVLSACSSSPEDRHRALACMLRRWSVTVHVHEQSGMPGPRMRPEGDWSRGEPLIKKVIPRVPAGCRVERRLFESLDGKSAGVLGIECGRGRWKKDCPAAGRVDGSFWSQ